MALAKLACGGIPAGWSEPCLGSKFPSPVGLAAGLDKDAMVNEGWESFGFGFCEIGTVTPRSPAGNYRPRLFRLPIDRAIINGWGSTAPASMWWLSGSSEFRSAQNHLGANIGKNKVTPNDQAEDDYRVCLEKLFPYVDYFVVNVSSPNTPKPAGAAGPRAADAAADPAAGVQP